jgi:hypothetical protein
MVVKKKIDLSVKDFIDNGAEVRAIKKYGYKNVLIRIPNEILNHVDIAVEKKPWCTRTQWIVDAIYEKVIKEE